MKLLMHPASGAENPFINLLVAELTRQGCEVAYLSNRNALKTRADGVLVHWPHNVVTKWTGWRAWREGASLLVRLLAQRLRGAKVLWLVHDLDSPDRDSNRRLKSLFMAVFMRLLTGLIYMDPTGQAEAERRHPVLKRLPSFTQPHPPFGVDLAQLPTPAQAKAQLGLPAQRKVVGFLGDIRDYKNLPELLSAFDALPSDDSFLFIAGAFHRQARREAVDHGLAALRTRGVPFEFLERRLSDEELSVALRACDLLVLPYDDRGPINSGFAVLALEHGTPLLVSSALAFRGVARDLGPPWVHSASLPLQRRDIEQALADRPTDEAWQAWRSYFKAASWSQFAGILKAAVAP